jgi:hypothetical protein
MGRPVQRDKEGKIMDIEHTIIQLVTANVYESVAIRHAQLNWASSLIING